MTLDRAKDIVKIGFAWANWTNEQKEAFRLLYIETEKVKLIECENRMLTERLSYLQENRQEAGIKKKWVLLAADKRIRCPTCNIEYTLDPNSPICISHTNYCPNCGQEMDATDFEQENR